MPIEFACPSCNQTLRVPDELAGKQARCPKCSAVVSIPNELRMSSPPLSSPFAAEGSPPSQNPFAGAANPYAAPHAATHEPHKPGVSGGFGHRRVEPGEVISFAFNVWKVNLGLLVGVTFFVGIVQNGLSQASNIAIALLADQVGQEVAAGLSVVTFLFVTALGVFLQIGQAKVILNCCRGQPAAFGDVFSGGDRFWPTVGISFLLGILWLLGFLLLIVPGVILMLMFWPAYYLVIDRRTPVFASFDVARSITSGNKGTMIVIWLACMGFMILGALACCVGLLFAAPLVATTFTVAYLMMSDQIR